MLDLLSARPGIGLVAEALPDLLMEQLQTLAELQRRADCLRDELATLHHQITDAVRQTSPRHCVPAELFGHETILIADDQIIVRAITQDILEGFGYEVLLADADPNAWPMRRLDVVLLDVPIHGVTGRVRQAKTRCERLIVMTPLPEGRARHELRQQGASAFVSKPLQSLTLARCVRELIG